MLARHAFDALAHEVEGSNLAVNHLLLDEKKNEEMKRADWQGAAS